METLFKIRALTKGQLASLYFPDIKKESASNQFRHWIKKNARLQVELQKTNWNLEQKILTPRQVRLIVDCFGEP